MRRSPVINQDGRPAQKSDWASSLLLAFACLNALSLVFAYACVPDPVWIPGVYDLADTDEEVTLVANIVALPTPSLVVTDQILPCYPLRSCGVLALPNSSLSCFRPRSPPVI